MTGSDKKDEGEDLEIFRNEKQLRTNQYRQADNTGIFDEIHTDQQEREKQTNKKDIYIVVPLDVHSFPSICIIMSKRRGSCRTGDRDWMASVRPLRGAIVVQCGWPPTGGS